MKSFYKVVFSVLFIFLMSYVPAQISGVFNIPNNFPSFAAAINTLNTVGVAGAVTINVNAGYTELAPAGGFKLYSIPGASQSNTIIIKKSGVGVNPLITAFTGTATPASLTDQDGVWWFIGTDFVTMDGIDIIDPNVSGNAMMEFGYGFYRSLNLDGCQNNTIKNCNITLNRTNGTAGNVFFPWSQATGGSRGIYMHCFANNGVISAASSATETNSYNKIYSNLINNCHTGICMIGHPEQWGAFADTENDIGGLSAASGNTVVNFGGAAGSETFGIRTQHQFSLNVSYNVITNNNGLGADPVTNLLAIYSGTSAAGYTSINNNTITLSSASNSTVNLCGIRNESGAPYGAANNSTVDIINNVFPSYTYTSSSAGQMYLITNAASAYCNISSNFISNVNIGTLAGFNFIVSMQSRSCTVSSNTVTAVSRYLISNGISILVTGAMYNTVSNNHLSNITTSSPFFNTVRCITTANQSSSQIVTVSSNTISGIVGTDLIGIQSIPAIPSASETITGNIISNFSSPPNSLIGTNFKGITTNDPSTNRNITGNTIYSITSTGSLSAPANSGNLLGIEYVGVGNIGNNRIYSFVSNGSGTVQGIFLSAANCTVHNNIIGDLHIPTSTVSVPVNALINNSVGNVQVIYNSFYLNTSFSSPNSGSSVLNFTNTGMTTIKNNILVNTSSATGTGNTVVIRKNNGFYNYSTTSDNNILYAGIPSANNLLYFDGVNSYSTLATFKNFVAPRDLSSGSELPPFITTNGAMANLLAMNPAIATMVESGASPVAGYTLDYAGSTRNATTPDIGAWEGDYTRADKDKPEILDSGFLQDACTLSGRTLTVSILDSTGVASGSLAPRVYFRINFGLYASTSGILSSGTATNGVWTFSLNYSITPGDVIYYFLAIQDQSYLNNLIVSPGTGYFASDVNTIFIPPVPAYNYTAATLPTVSVNSGTICEGQSFTLASSGAFSYTYSSGSPVVNPSVTSNFSVVGANASGCLSTNTAIAYVVVKPLPVLSINGGTVCSGQPLVLLASGALNYTWTGGTQSPSIVVSPQITTSYAVSGTGTNNCINSTTTTVVVEPLPSLIINASSQSVCFGNSVTLVASGAPTFTWVGTVVNNTPFYPANTTSYFVSGTGSNGCQKTTSIQIVVNPIPTVSVNSSSALLCDGETTTLTATGATYYYWTGGPNDNEFIISPTVTTDYTVNAISATGCTANSVYTQLVDICLEIKEKENKKFGILVYPNPTAGDFTLLCSEPGLVIISNVLGEEIKKIIMENTNNDISIAEFLKGIYFINVKTKNYEQSLKIVKQ